jgi:hypothetical protein
MPERSLNVIALGIGVMLWASIALVPAIRHRWGLLAGSVGLLLFGAGSGLLAFGDAPPNSVTPRSAVSVMPPIPGPIVRSRDEVRRAPTNPVSWRISPDQREIFRNCLKSAGITASVIIRLDNANSATFKNELASMIGSTPGWSVFDFGDSGIDTIGVAGISIQVPDAESPPPAATALMKAFLAARIEPMPVLSGGFNAVQIVVGAPQADVAAPAME